MVFIEINLLNLQKAERRGLVKKKVTVHRKGKTFTRNQWVRPGKVTTSAKPKYTPTDNPEYDGKISKVLNDLDDRLEKGQNMSSAVYEIIGSPDFGGIKYDIESSEGEEKRFTGLDKLSIRDDFNMIGHHISTRLKDHIYKVKIQRIPRIVKEEEGDRSYHSGNVIALSDNASGGPNLQRNLMHEYGHHIELWQPVIRDSCISFYVNRIRNAAPVQLKTLFPYNHYRDNEFTYPDKFIEPYIGKLYSTEKIRPSEISKEKIRATEVLSVGFEKMITEESKTEFYKKDKEHFGLILAIMAGEIL